MIRLIFSGSLSYTPNERQLSIFLAKSRERFGKAGISGLMILMGRDSLQIIEGYTTVIEQEYDRLADSGQRFRLMLLARQTIETPMFAGWRLGLVRPPQPSEDGTTETPPLLLDIQRMQPRNRDERRTLNIVNEFIEGKWHHATSIDFTNPFAVLKKHT